MVRRERRSTAAATMAMTTTTTTGTGPRTTSTRTANASRTSTTTTTAARRGGVRRRAFYALLGLALWLHVQQVTLAASATAYGGDDEDDHHRVAVGRSAHEPKFGERLLPLRKQTAAGARALAPPPDERSVVNKFLSKSNYVVSAERAGASAARVKSATSGSAATANASAIAMLGAAPTPSATEHEAVAVSTLGYADADEAGAETTLAEPPVRRQSKQLNRREDTNIAAEVANVSTADRLEMSTEFFIVPTSTSVVTSSSSGGGGGAPSSATARVAPKSRGIQQLALPPAAAPPGSGPHRSVLIVAPKSGLGGGANHSAGTPPTIVATHPAFAGLRKEPWVVPVLVFASLSMIMMGAFEIFVLFKAWRTSPSRRHLFLGQMLLLGLFACAGLGAIITAQPSLLSCGAIRFGVGVAYALVFAALLVKCVFLISLNGGVYLPAPYQGLLLLFAVLIQVAIGAQWLLTQPPEIYTLSVPIVGSGLLASTVASSTLGAAGATASVSPTFQYGALFHPSAADLYTRITATGTTLIPLCKTQFAELLYSLIYIVFLIVFVAVLAIKSRGIRDNYREATYIGLAIGGAIPIWLGWMLCGLAVAERHKDACIAFGLVATSATVFLVMFMPKGRQLAAMGKEGLYVEDREEQFSSLSRAGSGYSPSFFHFKPIKYGVMGGGGGGGGVGGGGMQSSGTNTANGANMKICSNGMSGGDRVALVTAAPPSYTRMYHYFPAHLTTHPFCYYPQPPPPPPPPLTQLPSPPTLKQLGNSLTSMTQAHIAQTLRYPGLFIRPDETNLYTTLEPTLSSNPNVYFQRGGAVHPGMMY